MNRKHQTRRLMLFATLVWLAYGLVANYLTFWSVADFARVADGPPTTFQAADAGWPVTYVKEYYSIASPTIIYEFDYARLGKNLLLIFLVQFAVIFVAWDMGVLRIRHLLLLTAVVGVVAMLAKSAAIEFGGSATTYFAVTLYLAPVACACIRLFWFAVCYARSLARRATMTEDRTMA